MAQMCSGLSLDRKIAIFELGADRILDDLIVPAVFPEMTESVWPSLHCCQFGAAQNGDRLVFFPITNRISDRREATDVRTFQQTWHSGPCGSRNGSRRQVAR